LTGGGGESCEKEEARKGGEEQKTGTLIGEGERRACKYTAPEEENIKERDKTTGLTVKEKYRKERTENGIQTVAPSTSTHVTSSQRGKRKKVDSSGTLKKDQKETRKRRIAQKVSMGGSE